MKSKRIISQYKQEFSIEGKSSLKGGLDVEKVEKVAVEEHIVPNVCDEKDMLEFMIEMHHRLD